MHTTTSLSVLVEIPGMTATSGIPGKPAVPGMCGLKGMTEVHVTSEYSRMSGMRGSLDFL